MYKKTKIRSLNSITVLNRNKYCIILCTYLFIILTTIIMQNKLCFIYIIVIIVKYEYFIEKYSILYLIEILRV